MPNLPSCSQSACWKWPPPLFTSNGNLGIPFHDSVSDTWAPRPKLRLAKERGCSCEPGDDLPPGLCFLEASLLRYGDYGWQNTLVFELGFPGSSADKESACDAGDPGSIPESGRSPGEGIGYPLQYSWASLVAQMVKNRSAVWKTRVRLLGWEDPLEEGMAHYSSVLAWRIPMDRGAWRATVHQVAKSRTPLSDWAWHSTVFKLVSSESPSTYSEKESAAVSGFYQPCAISEHLTESGQLERDGWAKPRIHSADSCQWTGVVNADDSLAPGNMKSLA